MESDVGRDIERTLLGMAVIYVIHMTVKRRLGRIEEAIWWALIGAFGGLAATAIWFHGLGPKSTNYEAGVVTSTTGGNEAGMWVLVAVCAATGLVLSLTTWYGAQVRRTRRENRRAQRRAARLARHEQERDNWRQRAAQ